VVAPDSPLAVLLDGPPSRKLGFRPESILLANDGIAAVVKHATYLGSKTELQVETLTGETLKLWTKTPVPPGDTVHFQVRPKSVILL